MRIHPFARIAVTGGGLLLAVLLLLAGVGSTSRAQQPTAVPEATKAGAAAGVPQQAQPIHVIPTAPMGTVPVTATGEPDCHGPLYYKMKKDDTDNKKRDSDRNEIFRFTFEMQDILVKKQNEERALLMAEKAKYSKRCEQAKQQPSLLCSGYSKRSLQSCMLLPDGFDAILCRVALGLDLGAEAAFPKSAEGSQPNAAFRTDDMAVSMLLEGAGTGRLECPKGLPAELEKICREAAAAVDAGAVAGASPEATLLAAWVMALSKRDSALCRAIPKPEHAEFCAAYLNKDLTACTMRRPLLDYVDQDWSCRSTILSTRLHPISLGSEVVLTLGSPYFGTGECTVSMVVEYGGTQNRRDVQTLTLKSQEVKEVRIQLAGEKFLRAESNCEWSDPHWGNPSASR